MHSPYPPERPVRGIKSACPFCNEASTELWLDAGRDDFDHQLRCSMCDARGPWSDAEGAVEAWRGVRAVYADEADRE
jgi:hypothetical protein